MSKRDDLRARTQAMQAQSQQTRAVTVAPSEPPASLAAPPAVRVKPVRQTLDLAPDHYERLHAWSAETARGLGVMPSKVNAQTTLRALVARMLDDPELATAVREDVKRSLAT